MVKDFIQYTEALELKQLGFDEPCFAFYDESLYFPNNENQYGTFCNQKLDASSCSAPTYSQAFRWFREKYKLKYCIIPLVCEQGFSDLYESRIHQEKHSISIIGNYKIYEEAELACLRRLIKLVKENHNQIVDEAYKNYINKRCKDCNKDNYKESINGGKVIRPFTKGEFIDKCKTHNEFSERWLLTIKERELSHDERIILMNKKLGVTDTLPQYYNTDDEMDKNNVPTKLITVIYNNETIEVYVD
jgi:hypothetical protein